MRWPSDWSIKDCLLLSGGITFTQIVLVVLAQVGIGVPILPQLTGFIFVTFVPGVLLLRILKIHNINIIESVVYSIGLSLALVMFSGAAINFILPAIKIPQPITVYPLTVTLVVEIIILGIAAWVRDRDFEYPSKTQFKWLPNRNSVLFLIIILLLVILGVKVSDMTGSNLILIVSLLLIATVVCLAAFKKFISPDIYPFAIFIISLSLLYQTTLMSPYMVGSDIYMEYQYYRDVASNGIWNYTLPNPINSCLSILMLVPVYSLMMGIDGMWVFKAVYPLLFALVPLILFRVFKPQIGAGPSFFAVFFFIAVPTFSLELISLCRQQVAEIFLALSILLLVERKLETAQKLILLTIFLFSIAVSHYSIGFITVAYIVLAIPLLAIIRSNFFINTWGKLTSRTGGLPGNIKQLVENSMPLKLLVIPVVLYVLFLLAWYSQIASSINLYFIGSVFNFQVNAIGNEISDNINRAVAPLVQMGNKPDLIRAALGLDFFEVTWQGKLFRIFQYATQLLIITGCLRLLFSPRELKLKGVYIVLSIISAGLLSACVVFPGFAGILNATRWYHISLIILAPFCVIGAETVWSLLSLAKCKILLQNRTTETSNLHSSYLIYLAMLVLVPYFIFTSGLVFEFSGRKDISSAETPYSIALSSYKLDITGILNYKDVTAAAWLAINHDQQFPIYTDNHANKIGALYKYDTHIYGFPRNGDKIQPGYLYFTKWNNERQELTFSAEGKPGLREHIAIRNIPGLSELLAADNLIYSNSDTTVYFGW